MSKCTIKKITQYQNAIVAKGHNKRITYSRKENGVLVLEFIRTASKEEVEKFKTSEIPPNQSLIRDKAILTVLTFTEESLENLRVFLNIVCDPDLNEIIKE